MHLFTKTHPFDWVSLRCADKFLNDFCSDQENVEAIIRAVLRESISLCVEKIDYIVELIGEKSFGEVSQRMALFKQYARMRKRKNNDFQRGVLTKACAKEDLETLKCLVSIHFPEKDTTTMIGMVNNCTKSRNLKIAEYVMLELYKDDLLAHTYLEDSFRINIVRGNLDMVKFIMSTISKKRFYIILDKNHMEIALINDKKSIVDYFQTQEPALLKNVLQTRGNKGRNWLADLSSLGYTDLLDYILSPKYIKYINKDKLKHAISVCLVIGKQDIALSMIRCLISNFAPESNFESIINDQKLCKLLHEKDFTDHRLCFTVKHLMKNYFDISPRKYLTDPLITVISQRNMKYLRPTVAKMYPSASIPGDKRCDYLKEAASTADVETLKNVISIFGEIYSKKWQHDMLTRVCKSGHGIDAYKYLISIWSDYDIYSFFHHYNFLKPAIHSFDNDLCKYIIPFCSDFDSTGTTLRAFESLAETGNLECLKLLIKHRGVEYIKNHEGYGIFRKACESGNLEMVEYLDTLRRE